MNNEANENVWVWMWMWMWVREYPSGQTKCIKPSQCSSNNKRALCRQQLPYDEYVYVRVCMGVCACVFYIWAFICMHIVYAVKGIWLCVRAFRFGILGARDAWQGPLHYLDVLHTHTHTHTCKWGPCTHTHRWRMQMCMCISMYLLILFSVVAVAVVAVATATAAAVASDLRRTHFHVLLFLCWEFLFVCYPTIIFIAHS